MNIYDYMQVELHNLRGAEVASIGTTTLGTSIPYVKLGDGVEKVLVVGATHAREYITSALILRLLQSYTGSATVYAVPMLNIDGVRLVTEGDQFLNPLTKAYVRRINGGNDYRMWKANIRAVDINVNFPIDWGQGVSNITYPASENYIGEYPASEVETQAIMSSTNMVKPSVVISYHSKGEVLYTGYKQYPAYPEYTKLLSEATGYVVEKATGSVGGYKDWYIANFGGYGVTIEVGSDTLAHPIGLEHLDHIYERNQRVLNIASDIAIRINNGNKIYGNGAIRSEKGDAHR